VVVAAKQNLAANRDAFVRALAALIDTAHFMNDPKNAEAVAKIATNTGHTEAVNKEALKQFLAIGFWAVNDDGMPRDKLEATVKLMKKVGAIKPDKVPVSFEQLVDATVWKDANAMVK
jgi:ABC-type nitrate/sulfonate/bicarbonate transport system substrate-binding protein